MAPFVMASEAALALEALVQAAETAEISLAGAALTACSASSADKITALSAPNTNPLRFSFLRSFAIDRLSRYLTAPSVLLVAAARSLIDLS